ncbi:hypothetical protein [Parendozoicomonas haliclonae]|uniref:Uncharacterized protein n=1 Tax=Parendozoicomonas haliclonae TaxID=1960125 RepID=A0A1X7ARP9_9GAMM|nr:hypothetical protein [Parendozoicomonas haliclonae]SMA50760.1 hypothetical protein EHSB41UT_04577 [Parendozoicomonas haliclonae]
MSGLGIFSGIEVLFFWLGVLCLATFQGLVWLRWKLEASWLSLALVAAGCGTMIFDVAWAVSSVLEKEPQSASMSVLVIFLPGLILAVMGMRLAWKQ